MRTIGLLIILLHFIGCYTMFKDPNQPVVEWQEEVKEESPGYDASVWEYDPYFYVDSYFATTQSWYGSPYLSGWRWTALYDPYYNGWSYYYPSTSAIVFVDRSESNVKTGPKGYKSGPWFYKGKKNENDVKSVKAQLFNPGFLATPKQANPGASPTVSRPVDHSSSPVVAPVSSPVIRQEKNDPPPDQPKQTPTSSGKSSTSPTVKPKPSENSSSNQSQPTPARKQKETITQEPKS